MDVRRTIESDLPSIRDILNYEIREGVAHFGLVEQPLEEIRAEFCATGSRHLWFSALEGGELAGFARSNPWKNRGAYAQTVELGVYVLPEFQGKGVGSMLYEVAIPALFQAGVHTILAGIRLPNDPCVRLHEKFGFRHIGVFPQTGFKFGEWHDVGYWALVAPSDSSSR